MKKSIISAAFAAASLSGQAGGGNGRAGIDAAEGGAFAAYASLSHQ